jgi:hypothetical protein
VPLNVESERLYGTVVDEISVMGCCIHSEIVIEGFTFHGPRILLDKAVLQFFNIEHSVLVVVDILYCTPHIFHSLEWVFLKQLRFNEFFIDLGKTFELLIFFDKVSFLLHINEFINTAGFASEATTD